MAYSIVLLAILFTYRQLLLVSFDPETATVLGLRVRAYEGLILVLMGLTVSAGVLIVGPVTLFGLLVIPPLAGHCLASSMVSLVVYSMGFGLLSALGGLLVSFSEDLPLGPTVCVVAALLLALAKLLGRLRA